MIKNKAITTEGGEDEYLIDFYWCPYCQSKNIEVDLPTMTLVATNNHYWHTCFCNDCKESFVWEHKEAPDGIHNYWITKDEKCFDGIPNCCEDKYKLQCSCNGSIERYFTLLDGHSRTKNLIYDNHKRKFRTFLECDSCGFKEEI